MDLPARQPDFENFAAVLRGGRGRVVPNAELVIDREIKDAVLGRPVTTLADEIAFRAKAGYDYHWVSVGMIDPAGTVNKQFVGGSGSHHFAGRDQRVWADQHAGIITSFEDLQRFPFPDPDALDYSPFTDAAALLPDGMKLIAVLGKIFTGAWQLMGMERFCEGLYTDERLVRALVERIGEIQVAVAERLMRFEAVGAIWAPDDVAFRTGTIIAPDWLAAHVFPYYRRIVEICHAAGRPTIYHSDGELANVLDVILDCGFDGLHPIEPESMDIYELRRRVGKRLCLLGNIRVHTLATGTPTEIRDLVRDRVQRLGHEGAYCVGASNSVPNYVPIENYAAMLEASAEFGAVPG